MRFCKEFNNNLTILENNSEKQIGVRKGELHIFMASSKALAAELRKYRTPVNQHMSVVNHISQTVSGRGRPFEIK